MNKLCFTFKRNQRGFSLVSAIFLLVVIAALGAAMVTLSSTQHQSVALDVQSARAYQAARSGLQWGMRQVANGNTCFASPASFAPAAATLNAYTVSVTCQSVVSNGVTIYQLSALACNFPVGAACPGNAANSNYVERQIDASM